MSQPTAEAYEDGIDLQIGLVEALPPQKTGNWTGYPFLRLNPSRQQEMRTFRTVVLENPYLKATLLPGLGGRIISLIDKRSGSEILRRFAQIEPQAEGCRGTRVREGIQLLLDGEERLNSLGNVNSQIEFSTDGDDDAVVWIAENYTGTGLSFHSRISLPAQRAELKIEVRVFNRYMRPQKYNGALQVYLGDGVFDGATFFSTERKVGLGVYSDGQVFDGVRYRDGVLRFARFESVQHLAGRQVDNWSVSIVPISGLNTLFGSGREAAVSIESGVFQIQTTEQRLAHKLFCLTSEGQTLEAKVDLYPETILEIPVGELNPTRVVLKDPGKNEVLSLVVSQESGIVQDLETSQPNEVELACPLDRANHLELQRATFDLSTRHLAYSLLGMNALAEKRYGDANEAFEQALMYNADDPLLWWAKAVSLRLADEDNQAELLNAHYLAPMEPALRAESFLSQPISLDADPSPLLVPLAENPEEFIEVACLLIDCGLYDQASRWIDEALRHRDLAMLRYLMAHCLLKGTRLAAEASDQVRLAGELPLAPPFPFRDVEKQAIALQCETFPDDNRLRTLMGLVSDLP